MKKYLLNSPLLLSGLFVYLLTANASAAVQTNSKLNLEPCTVPSVSSEAKCGKLAVFENRRTNKGRRINLNLIVFPARAARSMPDPVFAIAGGPGQAATQAVASVFYRDLEPVNKTRDIVLIDQRGTGDSNSLNCPMDLKETISYIGGEYPVAKWRECREELEKKADLRFYTTPIAMDDLDEARAALGYEKINLFGGSYGSRAALVYLRQHPEHVRSVILRAPISTDGKLPLYAPRDAQAALDKLFEDCARDEKCSKAYPNLRETLNSLFAQLEKAPPLVKARDSQSGGEVEIKITRDVFAAGVFYMLFTSDLARHLPLVISNAQRGNYATFTSITVALAAGLMNQVNTGMYYSVICSEDVPRIRKTEIVPQSINTFLGSRNAFTDLEICRQWRRGQMPSGYYQPIASTAPVLIISGEVDPTLPPHWGAAIARSLPNSRHFILPGIAHGPNFPGCVQNLITQFISEASAANLDSTCVKSLRRPEFTLPADSSAPPKNIR